MLKSMTGFSKSEASETGLTVSVEIKSLNGRNLDINCRMPKSLFHKELEVREAVRKQLARGSVQINVNVDYQQGAKPFVINVQSAENVYKSLTELKKHLKMKDAVSMEDLMNFSNEFCQKDVEENEELIWKLVSSALNQGLVDLNKMRAKEGENIRIDMEARGKKLHDLVKKIEVLGIDRIPTEREKLRQRIAQLFENDEIDEQRLQMEIVLLADKLDISEECVRLHSHLKLYFELLKSEVPVGQKYNFLMQELNREINTIGSKINDATVAHLVVECKDEIERIREQVQNIE